MPGAGSFTPSSEGFSPEDYGFNALPEILFSSLLKNLNICEKKMYRRVAVTRCGKVHKEKELD
jgi:hypothetical protein